MMEIVAAMGMRNPKVVGTECDKVASEKVATEPIPEGEETNHAAILREEQGSRQEGRAGENAPRWFQNQEVSRLSEVTPAERSHRCPMAPVRALFCLPLWVHEAPQRF